MQRIISGLFLAYLVLFPFGQLTRFGYFEGVFGQEAHFYLTDIVLFFLLIGWGIWRFFLLKKKYTPPKLTLPIFLFGIVAFVSLGLNAPLLSGREVVVAGLYLFRWVVYAGFYFVLNDLKKHFKWLNRENLINFLIGLGVFVAIFGLAQYLLWPDLRPLEVLEWDPHYYRVVGAFLDPGFTGLILALTLILIYFRSFHLRGVPTLGRGHLAGETSLLAISGIIVYSALALTYSRSSYLAYMVGMGVIAFLKKSPRLFLGAFLLGAMTLLILPRPPGEGGRLSRAYTIRARIENWQNSLVIARDHPLFGVGFNAYRYAQRDYGFLAAPRTQRGAGEEENWPLTHSGAGGDSSLLFVLATTGVVGLAAYLWIWLKAMGGKNKGIILASLAAVLAHSFFLNSLFYPWVMAWVWILLAHKE